MNVQLTTMWNNMVKAMFGTSNFFTPTKPRKKSDCTKLTQIHYDFIMTSHIDLKKWNKENPKDRKTTMELTNILNDRLSLNKSVTAYARVWNNRIDRDSLATGNKHFIY